MVMNYEALPLYIQISQKLRESIQQGVYQAEEKLPSEHQLSDRFGVNRHTLRRAIALLKDEGLLRTDKGRGIFVATPPLEYPIGKRVRYNEALEAQGKKGSYELLKTAKIPAEPDIAKKLEIAIGAPVAIVQMLGFADKHPLLLTTSYFPLTIFPDLLQHLEAIESVSKLMQEVYGCEHIRRSTYVSARQVRPQDARTLQIALNQSILLVESINEDQQGRVIEYGITRFRGDDMKLVLTS
ncbi:phosphonate metabolism transcriptional regulator PhnF [Pleurocapsa sp. FMAR1]|uniref:phosphonate metabolism transcriptional regulator PhnF n=1 Tax=Pleurocapsa sp. FMAR1 TaxID=3040204 RepID=UPI0029C95B8D|nr:phosphonate metabolism transcriptional regulator PhnF [Pleurocapsa sp. FMAR1]